MVSKLSNFIFNWKQEFNDNWFVDLATDIIKNHIVIRTMIIQNINFILEFTNIDNRCWLKLFIKLSENVCLPFGKVDWFSINVDLFVQDEKVDDSFTFLKNTLIHVVQDKLSDFFKDVFFIL